VQVPTKCVGVFLGVPVSRSSGRLEKLEDLNRFEGRSMSETGDVSIASLARFLPLLRVGATTIEDAVVEVALLA